MNYHIATGDQPAPELGVSATGVREATEIGSPPISAASPGTIKAIKLGDLKVSFIMLFIRIESQSAAQTEVGALEQPQTKLEAIAEWHVSLPSSKRKCELRE